MKKIGLVIATAIVFSVSLISTSSKVTAQKTDTGTCCTETNSECIVGEVIRENKYFKSEGSCMP